MILMPGQLIRIKQVKTEEQYEAIVIKGNADDSHFLVSGVSSFAFSPGDEIYIELPRREDALYIFKARVCRTVLVNSSCHLWCDVLEPTRVQRRKEERMPVNIQVECTLLPDEGLEEVMLEGLILNISSGGVFLNVKKRLPLDLELLLMFEVAVLKGNVPIGVTGTVVREYCKPSSNYPVLEHPYAYGVKFKTLGNSLAG